MRVNAKDTSIPFKVNNPSKEPSVIPSPPGINEMIPIMTEEVYIEIVSRKDIVSISYAKNIK